ncbi:MAG TPA: YhbY family RNA-binding protein [Verrucomicrobiae bacterium]|nr:YhbY family RNA-binding protein [Verrucomicrobiae bacterium]
METLTNPEIRKLKARAQHLEPMFKVGKAGLSEGFVKSVAEGLAIHELVKVKFAEFKEDKKTLAPLLAEKTSSHLIMRVGNVVVLYRRKPAAENAPTAHGPPPCA